jgi:hypothetical protein
MRLFSVKQIILLCILVAGVSVGLMAQNVHGTFNIYVFDDFANTDSITLAFGVDTHATRGIDEALGEIEIPPGPPSFDARFSNNQLAAGTQVDYLPVSHTATRIDTFVIAVTNGDGQSTNANFGLIWDHNFYAAHTDTMTLKIPAGSDIDGNTIPARKINMRTTDSVWIPEAQVWSIKNLTVLARIDTTNFIIGAVHEVPNVIPSAFRLGNSYPNPFNPSTTIRFDIAKSAIAEISVYNILGQKVSTLVSQDLKAGAYTTVWNGTSNEGNSVASGIYFVRMTARSLETGAEQFSALQKVVLMK